METQGSGLYTESKIKSNSSLVIAGTLGIFTPSYLSQEDSSEVITDDSTSIIDLTDELQELRGIINNLKESRLPSYQHLYWI